MPIATVAEPPWFRHDRAMMGDDPNDTRTATTGPGLPAREAAVGDQPRSAAPTKTAKPAKPTDRRGREAAALRANLAKRKAFQRARNADPNRPSPDAAPGKTAPPGSS